MRPQGGHVLGAGLAVGQPREQRREAIALGARLDAGHAVEKRLAALGEATIDLRVGPARLLADLLVRVALGAQQQAANLLRLQAADGLRSEERRVGKECRTWREPEMYSI